MTNRTTLLKQALLVLLLVPWAPDYFNLSNMANAQSDALIIGNSWLDNDNAVGTPVPLPTPGASVGYGGQHATRSQVARSDGDGNLLFFAIDGNAYDGAGYLIADAQGINCSECIYPGTMEMLAVPVPGSCFLYYLITMNADDDGNDGEPHIQVSFLDLAAWNTTTARYGKIWPFEQVADQYPQFADFTSTLFGMGSPNVTGQLNLPFTFVKSTAPRLRVIDPTGNGSQYFLFGSLAGQVVTFRIDANGIHPTNTGLGGHVLTEPTTTPIPPDSYSRDADLVMSPTGDIMLALTCKAGDIWQPGTENFTNTDPVQVLIMYFNATNGDLIDISGVHLDGTNGSPDFRSSTTLPIPYQENTVMLGAKGCAIVNGGTQLMISGERQTTTTIVPSIVLWDIITGNWTDVSTQFGITDLGFLRARLYRGTFPGGQTPSVLLPGPIGCAAFVGTDNTTSMTYVPQLDLGTNNVPPHYVPAVNAANYVETPPRFLNAQITNDNFATYFASTTEGECCRFREGSNGRPGFTIVNSDPWSATSNPFGNQSEVTFTGDLVVPAGMHLYVSNMTLRFAPNAKLIVQRGGKAHFLNTKLTSLSCTDLRWPGIRVEGNTANPYQDNNLNLPVGQEQAWLVLSGNSIVENARYGVWCAREFESDNPDPAYYGGVVRATNTRFINCLRGVQVEHYHRFNANNPQTGTELPNRSLFLGCHFETNDAWPSGTPSWMAYIEDVRHIRFASCSFENAAPADFPPDETGGGVFLFNATVYVDGNSNPEQSYIKGFRMGVFNNNGELNSVRVSKMHFDNNVYGIADLQSSFVEYAENTFQVPDQGNAPNPRVGMLLWQTKHFTVEKNSFDGETRESSVGIFFVGYKAPETEQEAATESNWSYTDEKIYNNTFKNLQGGTLLTGLMRGNAWGNQDAGLQIFCGDYTDNLFDIAVLPRTMVRPNQGGVQQLAGNRFTNNADCSSNYDWALDVDWNQIPGIYPMELDYKRHEFPDDLVGVTCDQWPDFDDLFLTGSGTFVKTDHCIGGVYPIELVQRPVHEASYLQAKNLLYAALATYNGTVDLGQTPNVKDAIQQMDPPLSSTYLRDLLLAKHPLSDEVLVMLLKRDIPLDAWHLTQVLLQNSKLNSGVFAFIKDNGLLSPFFYVMVEQAQQGSGITAKQALEQEIVQRRLEMTEQINVLGHIYARDTIGIPQDSLKRLMSHDQDHQFLQKKFEMLLAEKRYAEADALLATDMAAHNGHEVMQDLLTMQQNTDGDWKALNEADKDVLWGHAEKGKAGAARAAAILMSIDADAPLPPVSFPNFTKSRSIRHAERPTVPVIEPALACFPNPASAISFLTYPSELDGNTLSIHDAKGALVHSVLLKGKGLWEIDTHGLNAGLYNISIAGTSLSTKLNVER